MNLSHSSKFYRDGFKFAGPLFALVLMSVLYFFFYQTEMQLILALMTALLSIFPIFKISSTKLGKSLQGGLKYTNFLVAILSATLLAVLVLIPKSGVLTPLGVLFPSGILLLHFVFAFGLYTWWFHLYKNSFEKIMGYCLLVSIGFTCIAVTWAIGYGDFVWKKSQALTDWAFTFDIWLRHRFWTHGFLFFEQTGGGLESKSAYHGYSTFYNIFHYIPLKFVHKLFGWPVQVLDRMSPVFYGILYSLTYPLIFISCFRGWFTRSLQGWMLSAGVLAILVTTPIFWDYTPPGQPTPLLAMWVVLMTGILFGSRQPSLKWVIILCAFFGLQLSYNAAIYGLILALIFSIDAFQAHGAIHSKKWALPTAFVTLGFFGVMAYVGQSLIAKIKHFDLYGSSWAFRSGLDGKMTDFPHVIYAVLFPKIRSELRVETLFWPACFIFVILLFLSSKIKDPTYRIVKGLFALTGVYLLNAALLPEAISLHPNSYDTLLVVPMFVGILFVFSHEYFEHSRLRIYTPWILLFFIFVLNHNFVMLSRLYPKLNIKMKHQIQLMNLNQIYSKKLIRQANIYLNVQNKAFANYFCDNFSTRFQRDDIKCQIITLKNSLDLRHGDLLVFQNQENSVLKTLTTHGAGLQDNQGMSDWEIFQVDWGTKAQSLQTMRDNSVSHTDDFSYQDQWATALASVYIFSAAQVYTNYLKIHPQDTMARDRFLEFCKDQVNPNFPDFAKLFQCPGKSIKDQFLVQVIEDFENKTTLDWYKGHVSAEIEQEQMGISNTEAFRGHNSGFFKIRHKNLQARQTNTHATNLKKPITVETETRFVFAYKGEKLVNVVARIAYEKNGIELLWLKEDPAFRDKYEVFEGQNEGDEWKVFVTEDFYPLIADRRSQLNLGLYQAKVVGISFDFGSYGDVDLKVDELEFLLSKN